MALTDSDDRVKCDQKSIDCSMNAWVCQVVRVACHRFLAKSIRLEADSRARESSQSSIACPGKQ